MYFCLPGLFQSVTREALSPCEFSLPLPCFLDFMTLFFYWLNLLFCSSSFLRKGKWEINIIILTCDCMWSYVLFISLRLFLSASWIVFVLPKLSVFVSFALFQVKGAPKMWYDSRLLFHI